ncbi:porin family protein [Pricia sp. S334]|uniref:Porin family protein n=1 Tax=Pricia mediterranea TaxID=3076079 RepID=A0ABU3L6X8_9FLAO|nr:porin family protein [Pricia sp. S334]MDT7829447.1 porin family protein [Pricia sp. S334]
MVVKEFWLGTFLLSVFLSFGQVYPDSTLRDAKYLEDQFYIGLTYNFLIDIPDNVNQRNLSYGLQAGIIKDIPINEKRTTAFGIGLGYGIYSYYSNLRAIETHDSFEYSVIADVDNLKRNKVETHMLEVPIEFRLRNSNAVDYKFWRLYVGVKLGYVFGGRSKYASQDLKESFYNHDIRKFQYGLTFNFGYNTFNLHAYYALNGLFEDNTMLGGSELSIRPLRVGLIFYIL